MSTQLTTIQTETPDPRALIDRSDLSPLTKEKYTRALDRYLETGNGLDDTRALAEYAQTISDTEKRWLSAVVSKWADHMALDVKGQSTPETVDAVVATLHRLDALKAVVKPPEQKGDKTHIWLSAKQVKRLSNEIKNGVQGARDRVAIGLLVAAGLRRQEAVNLEWSDIKLQPVGEKMRTVLAIKGKGARNRTVPISDQLANDLDVWAAHLGQKDGKVLRSLGRLKTPGQSLSSVALFKTVRKYGGRIDVDDLAPHDLRRTYAKLAFAAGVDIGQLSILLGHEDVATTMRYLGLELDLATTASDFIPW